ncbi:hypothetical protein [uncultured Methanobrevibacter sp.]|nr:hypothetical protein [uncultured Methanobrevibacter sp.]
MIIVWNFKSSGSFHDISKDAVLNALLFAAVLNFYKLWQFNTYHRKIL